MGQHDQRIAALQQRDHGLKREFFCGFPARHVGLEQLDDACLDLTELYQRLELPMI